MLSLYHGIVCMGTGGSAATGDLCDNPFLSISGTVWKGGYLYSLFKRNLRGKPAEEKSMPGSAPLANPVAVGAGA